MIYEIYFWAISALLVVSFAINCYFFYLYQVKIKVKRFYEYMSNVTKYECSMCNADISDEESLGVCCPNCRNSYTGTIERNWWIDKTTKC